MATREREGGNSAEKICKQPKPQRPSRGTSAISGLARANNIGLRDDLAWWLYCPTALGVKDKILAIDPPHELRAIFNSLFDLLLRIAL